MALRHHGWMVLAVALLAAACGSTPALPEEEVPGDFVFSYEMTATDEEAFLAWLAAEAMVMEPEPETATEGTSADGAAEPTEESAAGSDGDAPPDEAGGMEPGDETAEPEDVTGLRRSYIYVEIRDPGHVKYEVRFGFGNPVQRSGSVDLSETSFRQIYDIVRNTDVFSYDKRYIGQTPTGKKETIVVKGNLKWRVIDIQGHVEPGLDKMWREVKAILLDQNSRIFDNPKERADIFVLDKRNLEFHRGDCVRLNEVSSEFRIRLPTVQQCLNREGWPCETCRPLER